MANDNEPLMPGDEAAPGTPGAGEDICEVCSGSGKLASGAACPNCGGSGRVMRGIGGG
jgi:RecJ-like exonuclease